MNPSDLYSNTLSVLTDARTAMLSSAWQTSLDGESQPVRVAAGNELIQLQGAILGFPTNYSVISPHKCRPTRQAWSNAQRILRML